MISILNFDFYPFQLCSYSTIYSDFTTPSISQISIPNSTFPAWLIFYYIQQFCYAHDRLAKRLSQAHWFLSPSPLLQFGSCSTLCIQRFRYTINLTDFYPQLYFCSLAHLLLYSAISVRPRQRQTRQEAESSGQKSHHEDSRQNPQGIRQGDLGVDLSCLRTFQLIDPRLEKTSPADTPYDMCKKYGDLWVAGQLSHPVG